MRQLEPSDFTAAIHPDALAAIQHYRTTGVLEWTPPPGTPTADETPRCPVCRDVGEVAVREPGQITVYVDCTACSLKTERVIERRAALVAKVRLDYRNRTFEDFARFAPSREMARIGVAAQEWAESGAGSVIFIGPEGALKTTLASAMYLRRVELGMVKTAEWVKTPDAIEAIRRSYDRDLSIPIASPFIEQLRTCELLVLDDLGAVNITDRNAPWVQEQLYQIIDYRADEHLATIFTSNLSTDQLRAQLGPALVSRIVGMCRGRLVIMDPGTDVRYESVP